MKKKKQVVQARRLMSIAPKPASEMGSEDFYKGQIIDIDRDETEETDQLQIIPTHRNQEPRYTISPTPISSIFKISQNDMFLLHHYVNNTCGIMKLGSDNPMYGTLSQLAPMYSQCSTSLYASIKAVSELHYWCMRNSFEHGGDLEAKCTVLYNKALRLFRNALAQVNKNSTAFEIISLFLNNLIIFVFSTHHPFLVPLVANDNSPVDFLSVAQGSKAVYSISVYSPQVINNKPGFDDLKPFLQYRIPEPTELIQFPFSSRLVRTIDEYSIYSKMEEEETEIYREVIKTLLFYIARAIQLKNIGSFHFFLSVMSREFVKYSREWRPLATLILSAYCVLAVALRFPLQKERNIYQGFLSEAVTKLENVEIINKEMETLLSKHKLDLTIDIASDDLKTWFMV